MHISLSVSVVFLFLLLSTPSPGAVASQVEPFDFQEREMRERWLTDVRESEDLRRLDALQRLDHIVGPLRFFDEAGAQIDSRRAAQALDDLMGLAAQLQGLYEMGSAELLDSGVREELDRRSRESINAARKVLTFINRGTDPAPELPSAVPFENLGDRLNRLAALYVELLRPTVQLIAGDVLDVGTLHEVRSGFATMQKLMEVIPQSSISLPTDK